MPHEPRILLVDDEEGIRVTLPPMLQSYGFSVTSVGTVPEALRLISQQNFDVLIADLNVGSPGDGFTVVSAMRRTQPKAVNFILTGYPAIETALEAIRQQVDDYLIKPTDIEPLVATIKTKLSDHKPVHGIQPRRLPDIIDKHKTWIAEHWLAEVNKDPELTEIRLPDAERVDHMPGLLQQALEFARGRATNDNDIRAATLHGAMRRAQGYTPPLIVREAKLLLHVLADCVQQNLLSIQVSNLIPDMASVWETIESELEISLRAFVDAAESDKEPHTREVDIPKPAKRPRVQGKS